MGTSEPNSPERLDLPELLVGLGRELEGENWYARLALTAVALAFKAGKEAQFCELIMDEFVFPYISDERAREQRKHFRIVRPLRHRRGRP